MTLLYLLQLYVPCACNVLLVKNNFLLVRRPRIVNANSVLPESSKQLLEMECVQIAHRIQIQHLEPLVAHVMLVIVVLMHSRVPHVQSGNSNSLLAILNAFHVQLQLSHLQMDPLPAEQ
jgi:hypothetical protein